MPEADLRPRPTVILSSEPIDFVALTERVRSHSAGAVLLFLGTVRELTGGRGTQHLVYEAHPTMALSKLHELAAQACHQWPICGLAVVHRVGHLDLGDVSVAIAVATPHRDQAYAAGRWLIDTLKLQVPIWKQEHWTDGQVEWVHPGTPEPASGSTLGTCADSPALPGS